MKNTSGFTHWVIVILISIMAVGLVGVAWYYEENKEETTTSTRTTSETNTNTTVNSNTNINKSANTNIEINTNTAANTNEIENTNINSVSVDESIVTEVTKTFSKAEPTEMTTLNEYSIATAAQVRKPTGITLNDIQVELYDSDLLDMRGPGRVSDIKCNSDYCLMTIRRAGWQYRVLRFEDGNFTDLSDQLPNFTAGWDDSIEFVWNGSYWLVNSYNGLLKYDGLTFTSIDLSLTSTQKVSAFGWNGSYWLVAVDVSCCVYDSNSELLHVDNKGNVIKRLSILTDSYYPKVYSISWGKNSWLIGANLYGEGFSPRPVKLLKYSGSGEPEDISALLPELLRLEDLFWDGSEWLINFYNNLGFPVDSAILYSYDGTTVTDVSDRLLGFDETSISTIDGRPNFYAITGYIDPVANVVIKGKYRDLSGYFAMYVYSGTTHGNQVIIGGESELEVLTFIYEPGRVYVSEQINQNNETITAVTLSPVHEIPDSTSITYEASNDNGATWHTVKPDVEYTFSTEGSVLLWRATLATDDTKKTPSISSITIQYTK